MSVINISIDGVSRSVDADTTGFKLFESKTVVAQRVNGEVKDLAHTVVDGDVIEAVEISSADGLNILRHSAAHVLAQAVQSINPEAKLGIGPPI
jgi:threonyl-tRNA synthetase